MGLPPLACNLALRMLVLINIVLGLPIYLHPVADMGSLVYTNVRIDDGLAPSMWTSLFTNIEHAKVDAANSSDDDPQEVAGLRVDAMYSQFAQSQEPCKKVRRKAKGQAHGGFQS